MKSLVYNLVIQANVDSSSLISYQSMQVSNCSNSGKMVRTPYVLQLHGKVTYLYSFSSYSVAMNTGKN